MSTSLHLSALFGLRRRFYRSIDLEKDIKNETALDGYILTPLAESTLSHILDGLRSDATNRAWTLTGPYGGGKSAFALYLTQLLGPSEHRATKSALQLARTAERLDERVRQARNKKPKGFLRVVIGGSRGEIFPRIVESLNQSVEEFFERDQLPRGHMKLLKDLQRPQTSGAEPTQALCNLISMLASDVVRAGGRGIVFIIDELGKFLEHLSNVGPGQADIFILQQLAELAARSGDTPVLVLTMLHQAFARYAVRLPAAARDEWAKVQGRFEDLAFADNAEQLLHLAAESILRKGPDVTRVYSAYDRVADVAIRQKLASQKLKETLRLMAPLHPAAALVLPSLFRQTLAQHERSLFSFLTSEYQNGFGAFLRETVLEKVDRPVFYRLDSLYDFLVATLGPALYTGPNGKRWAEMEQSLNRLSADEPPLTARIVKVVGLLSQFGTKEFRAEKETICFALVGDVILQENVEETIDRLEQQSVLVYRRYNQAYGLWEGSDIDIEQHFQQAKGVVDRGSITGLLRSRLIIEPRIARRHFIETGTLRYFQVELIRPDELESRSRAPLEDEDGRILSLLPRENDAYDDVLQQAQTATRDNPAIVICMPKNPGLILDTAITWCTWSQVRETVTELEGDPVARRELAACLQSAAAELDRALQAGFGFGGRDEMTTVWVQAGQVQEWATPRIVTAALSSICNEIYKDAPLIQNELLNRRVLSSSAAGARKDLLVAMCTKGDQERLGMEGTPPEYSMYASLLEQGGFHRKRGDRWGFGEPPMTDPLRLRPAWECIQRFFKSTELSKRPVTELYKELAKPPYGIKDGAAPVIFLVAILAADDEAALFEEGTYVPDLSAPIIERFLRRPQRFEVAHYTINGSRTKVLEQLAELLITDPEKKPKSLTLVRELYQRAALWPHYARATQRLSAEALALRRALLTAKDPLHLLFIDIPQAVGLKPSLEGETEPLSLDLTGSLRSALAEINNAYPNLLQEIEHQFIRVLSLRNAGSAMRDELTKRAKAIRKFVTDVRLHSFVLRAVDETLSHDIWMESLAALVAGKPPLQWLDTDVGRFDSSLFELGQQFVRTEELAFDAEGVVEGGDVVDLLRVSVASYGAPERRRLVRLHPIDEQRATQAQDAIDALLDRLLKGSPEMKLAVLGRLSRHVIDALEERRPQPRAQVAHREMQ